MLTRIMIPLTKPGIISGIMMVFVDYVRDTGHTRRRQGDADRKCHRAGILTSMNWHLGSGLSIALMIFVMISMLFTAKSEEGKESAETDV
ncbi:MAG: hypothetical protein V8R14_06450 [Clostridia bacterium]